jgi:hypothetical protein
MRILVSGDVTLDWNLFRRTTSPRPGSNWSALDETRTHCQPGGAALLAELLTAVGKELHASGAAEVDVDYHGPPTTDPRPYDPAFHHSYALWSPFLEEDGEHWRVVQFLGLHAAGPVHEAGEPPGRGPDAADVVVLDDANLGFRTAKREAIWPAVLENGAPKWVVVKMAAPVADGPLWEWLEERHSGRLVALMRINDLRLAEVQISRDLSWERTAEDLCWELVRNPRVNRLTRCAHVIVSFDGAGALLLSADGRCCLFFDPLVTETTWTGSWAGGMVGYTSCLTAGVVRQLLIDPNKVELGIVRGLEAIRTLHASGYCIPVSGTGGGFPIESVVATLGGSCSRYAKAAVRRRARLFHQPHPPLAGADAPLWRILEEQKEAYPEGLERLAEAIAVDGIENALRAVPVARFGDLVTVDRHEIEAFRSISTLIDGYCQAERPRRPLSIAVFGPPGSGKSFGVEAVAKSVVSGGVKKLTFNLSQLHDAHELHGALHQVRDVGLGGLLPLVFWDEFDCTVDGRPLGWLRHFLAPMQDGTFQQGELTHPIGPAIFVFAGGTSERMDEFAAQQNATFREAKGPDFVSRLKGYVDILGPNPRGGNAVVDPYHVIRRAILLRSILRRDAAHLFKRPEEELRIDRAVLRAFLQTRTYRHGARSLESIVAMSRLDGRDRFARSALPSEAQLELHADGRDFLALVQAFEFSEKEIDRLAEQVHVYYSARMLAAGDDWSDVDETYLRLHPRLRPFVGRAPTGKPHASLRAWEHLRDPEKAQNYAAARDIPRKLALRGYAMRPKRAEPCICFTDEDVDVLAEDEHERWLWEALRHDLRYGPIRDRANGVHPAMLPWRRLSPEEKAERYGEYADRVGDSELPEDEKDKDRDFARAIPEMLDAAGYAIVRVE